VRITYEGDEPFFAQVKSCIELNKDSRDMGKFKEFKLTGFQNENRQRALKQEWLGRIVDTSTTVWVYKNRKMQMEIKSKIMRL
jgi:hypothetical protein